MTSLFHWCAAWMMLISTISGAAVMYDEQDAVDRLVERFAPLLYLHPEERWLPDDVDTFLSGVSVLTGDDDLLPVINGSLPTGPDTEEYHIVAPLPTGVGTPEVQHAPFLGGSGPDGVPVYVTVTHCDGLNTNRLESLTAAAAPSFLATYWTFHPFNEGKWAAGQMRGNHVGDWEHVTIRVQDGELTEIYISAHEFGAYYTFSPESGTFNFSGQHGVFFSPKFPPHVQLNGTHPVLYVARGSHGLWPTEGEHQYSGAVRLVDVTARGAAWRSWRRLVRLGRAPPSWLQYSGRWGNPADCFHLVPAFCQVSRGPPGIGPGSRSPDFFCDGGRPWRWRLFGRRRRRRAAGPAESAVLTGTQTESAVRPHAD